MRASLDVEDNTSQNSNFLPLGMMAVALKKDLAESGDVRHVRRRLKDLAERKWQYCDA